MGLIISTFLKKLSAAKDARILLLGLDAAGKTSILYKLKMGDLITTIPTIGFNVEEVDFRGVHFTMWDIGGQDRIRRLWEHYYRGTRGVVFVVDSADTERLKEARHELHSLMNSDELRNASLIVMANKQDMPNAMKTNQLAEGLGLSSIRQKWFIQPTSAVTGEGLYEGLTWLVDHLPKKEPQQQWA